MKKVILITGCSSGFGFLAAKRLSLHHIVYATTRQSSDIRRLKNLPITHLYLDVTKESDCRSVIEFIKRKEGLLDVLINNAGYALAGFFEELTMPEIRAQFETNFFGLQYLTQCALPLLRKSKEAKIINISSIAGIASMPCLSAYNASKFALEGFSESLRFELIPFKVDVILIEPGAFKTRLFTDNKQIAASMGNKKSDYYHFSSAILKKLDFIINRVQANPDIVAAVIEKVVGQRKPPFRILIGVDAKLRYALKTYLPFSWYEWLYKQILARLSR